MFSFLLSFVLLGIANAEPLGTFPQVDTRAQRIIVESQSDLWTRPYSEKDDPFRRYDVSFKSPVIKQPRWNAGVSLETDGVRFGRPDLVVGNDRVEITQDLRTQTLGLTAGKQDPDGGRTSLYLKYESASDVPFHDRRDTYFTGAAVQVFAPIGNWQPILGADYSRNRGYFNGRPMPLVGTFYAPSAKATFALGFAFFLAEWRPEENTVYSLTVTPVSYVALLKRDLTRDFWWQVKAGIFTHAYLHTQRRDEANRIFFEERNLEGGVGMRLSKKTTAALTLGRSFARRVYEGREIFKTTGEVWKLDNDYFAALHMEFEL
jgi:hypothetical protein